MLDTGNEKEYSEKPISHAALLSRGDQFIHNSF